jgi:hypothetical protein
MSHAERHQAAAQGEMARIVITASGGTQPYEFYVFPETEWLAGDLMHDMLEAMIFRDYTAMPIPEICTAVTLVSSK